MSDDMKKPRTATGTAALDMQSVGLSGASIYCLVIGDGVPVPDTDYTTRIGVGQDYIEVSRDGKLTFHGAASDAGATIAAARASLLNTASEAATSGAVCPKGDM